MPFCIKCGSKLNDGAAFCGQCGNPVNSAPNQNTTQQNTAQPTVQNQTAQNQASQNQAAQGMHESFSPKWGLGGKSFTFTDDSLIYGNETIPYTQLTTISILTPPTKLTNGVAQTKTKDGRFLTLAYEYNQKDRFAAALSFVNEKIDEANDQKDYQFRFQSPTGTKIEVYEDYLMMYYVSASATKVFSNAVGGGATGKIVHFPDISDIQFTEPVNGNNGTVQFIYPGGTEGLIPVLPKDVENIKSIIAFIEERKTSIPAEIEIEPDEPWEIVKGSSKSFPFMGQTLEISESLDEYNTYRLKFRAMAIKYQEIAQNEYKRKVHNLETFLEFYPKIYDKYLDIILQRAVDVLISNGVWTVTTYSFSKQHRNNFHSATKAVDTTLESIELTVNENQQRTAGLTSLIPNLQGGGFGFKGAMKGIAKATAFNVVRDSVEASAINKAGKVKQAQRVELYNRIKPDVIFLHVYSDYFGVFHSFVNVMNQNGHTLWHQPKDENFQRDNIFRNIQNPNFPKDKVKEVLLDLLKTDPYKKDIYKYIIEKFGETEEISAILNYLGYDDLKDYRKV